MKNLYLIGVNWFTAQHYLPCLCFFQIQMTFLFGLFKDCVHVVNPALFALHQLPAQMESQGETKQYMLL